MSDIFALQLDGSTDIVSESSILICICLTRKNNYLKIVLFSCELMHNLNIDNFAAINKIFTKHDIR